MTEKVRQLLSDKPSARWTALILLATAMFFGYMFMEVLSPLQTALETTKGWSPDAYGHFTGSETFLNVFIFFLIFAGIILDKMGVRFTAILSGSVMLVGAFINYYALTESFANSGLYDFFNDNLNLPKEWWNVTPFFDGMPASAKMSAIGFMIFGCGVEMAGITVSRGIVKWFQGKEMALAMGIEMALARVGVFAVFLISPPIAGAGGSLEVSRSVGFVVLLLLIGLISFIAYSFMDRKLEKQMGNNGEEKDDPFKISDLKYIFRSKVFWIVALLCVLYYSAIFPFQKYAANMLQCNLGISAESAAVIFSIFPLGAAAITPFLGRYLDRKGKGATMLIYGAVLMIACHLTFAIGLPAMRGADQEKVTADAIITGTLVDSEPGADGKAKVHNVVFSPGNLTNADVAALFEGKAVNSTVTFNPRTALTDATIGDDAQRTQGASERLVSFLNDDDLNLAGAASIDRDYTLTIKEIKAPMGIIGVIVAFLAIILLGISFSLVPASLWPSVPKLVENRLLGSAYAVIFWIQNIGLYAVPMIIGGVLAATNANVGNPLNYDYTVPMLIFASFGIAALFFGLTLKRLDRKHHYGLEEPNTKQDLTETELDGLE